MNCKNNFDNCDQTNYRRYANINPQIFLYINIIKYPLFFIGQLLEKSTEREIQRF